MNHARGEYWTKNPKTGLWFKTPNIFTLVGWEILLGCAFQGNDFDWFVGLCDAVPAQTLTLAAIGEPGATNGYARQALSQGPTDWPTIDTIEGEAYVESKEFTFTATGAYDAAATRLFITDGTDVISISQAFQVPVTYSANSTHKYRLYFR